MPSQSFSHTAVTSASAETVWSALQQPSTWADIGGIDEVSGARYLPDGDLAGYEFWVTVAGIRYQGKARTAIRERPKRMSVEIDGSELAGCIDIEISERNGRMEVAVTLEARPRGFLATMAFPLIASAIGNGLAANVEEFTQDLGA